MSRLNYALIGCGRRGKSHLNTVAEMKDMSNVVAVCDAHPESAENAAARMGVKAYTDVRQLIAHEKLDVCGVVVPAGLHHVVSYYTFEEEMLLDLSGYAMLAEGMIGAG